MKRKPFAPTIAMLVVIAVALVYIYHQTTFNFGFLAICYLGITALVAIVMYWLQSLELDEETSKAARRCKCVLAAASIAVLGGLSLKALHNYFEAPIKVYTNADHNALRIDGIRVGHPEGFVLAGNSKSAFFDDPTMRGRVSVVSVGENSVRLRLDNFTRPIYKVGYDEDKKESCYSLLGKGKTVFHFKDSDILRWRTNNGGIWEMRFSPGRIRKKTSLPLLYEYVDTMRYHVYDPDGIDVVSNDSTMLKHGTRLDLIAGGTAADRLNLSWLHVVRDTAYAEVKPDERIKTYSTIGYHLAMDNLFRDNEDEYPVAFSVDGCNWFNVDSRSSEEVELPLDTVFVIGYGSQRTQPARFCMNSGTLELRYRMPIYRYLSHGKERCRDSMLLLTSRQQLLDIIDEAVDNVAIVEVFNRMDNIYNMQPQLITYDIGRTSDSLHIAIGQVGRDKTLWNSTVRVPTAAQTKHDVKWLLGREDFKQTSHCKPAGIRNNVLLLTSAFFMLLLFGAFIPRATTTSVEFVAYAVTLFLVTLRWFLLWRSSVFLPVSGVSWYEFESLFRNPDNVRFLIVVLLGACIIFFVAKITFLFPKVVVYVHGIANKTGDLSPKAKCVVSFVILIVCACISLISKFGGACVAITVPAWLYLFSTVCITSLHGGNYDEGEATISDFSHSHRSSLLLFFSVLSTIAFAGCYAFIDKGYCIIFLTFSLFWLIWLFYDHVVCYLHDNAFKSRIAAIMIVFVFGLVLIGFYKEVFGLLYYDTKWAMLIFAIVGFVLFGLIAYVMAVRNWRDWRLLTTWALIVLVMAALPYGIKDKFESSAQHTVARIMVHFSDADEITRTIDHPANERRFYQAASNHSIIREYAERGEDVNLFGEDGAGYFKMQPHSKVGAMWGAQLTDISIVRYVIAEHSRMLPVLVILLFLLILAIAAAQPKHERWTRALLILIPLWLTVQSLLIWMATTGRFIFLGQDFPMLSINSRLVIAFYFSLIVIWVVVAGYSQASLRYTADEEDSTLKWRIARSRTDALRLFIIIFACIALGCTTKPSKNTVLSDLTAQKSRLDDTVAQLDNLLSDFQTDSTRWCENREFRRYVSATNGRRFTFKSFKMHTNLHEFIGMFDSQSVKQSNVFTGNPLAEELWTRYVRTDSRNNDLSQIIHARMGRDHKLHLVLKYNFYKQHLPLPSENQWRGNIIGSNGNGRKQYWARNFQINGHRELVYPNRDFFWIRTFGEEILAQHNLSSQKDDAFLNKDIELTLSPKLNSDLVSALRGVGVGASVIVANGDGEVWAIAEVKPKKYQLDPNNVRALQRFTDSLELYGGRGGEAERMVYGNANLRQIQYGPGSSQKPLVWTAVASQLNYNWDKLAIDEYANVASTDGDDFKFVKFAGQNFTNVAPFKPLKSDENNGQKVSLDGFMSHSSNVYNAVMAYIGSFTFEQLHQSNMLELDTLLPDGSPSLFRSYYSNDKTSFNDNFPIMQNANGQRIVFSRQLVKEVQSNSWINESMTKMFFRGTDNDTLNNKGDYDTSAPEYLCSYKKNTKDSIVSTVINGYAYVERSKFQSRGGDSISQNELMELAIRSTAIGAGRVWKITPWKMAESYGRMASLNSNLHLGIVKRTGQSHEYRMFSNLSDGYQVARPLQMRGMRDVFFSSNGHTSKGTAHEMSEKRNKNNDEWLHFNEKRTILIQGKEFFLYGKTGTTDDGKRNGKASNRHRIGIIITNKDLTTTRLEELEGVRYVTMYFTMPGGAQWNLYARVINKVMESEEFRNYMFSTH